MKWTPNDLAQLRKLWGGPLSASKIGGLLGKSRNAVIGKAHRINLPPVTSRGPAKWRPMAKRTKPRKKTGQIRVFTPKPKPVRREPVPEPNSLNLTLMQLEPGQCKWPVNDGGPFLFCGHVRQPGTPYCEHHFARSVAPKADRHPWKAAA